jgi:hypothetical protein
VAECWNDWVRNLTAVFQADPDSARTLTTLMQTAMASSLSEITEKGEPLASKLREAALRYSELWRDNRLDDIRPVLADFAAELQRAGFDPNANSQFAAFRDDPAVQKLLGQLQPPDCDGDFVDMINGVLVEG